MVGSILISALKRNSYWNLRIMTTAYTASNSLPMSGLPAVSGIVQKFVANATNNGAATYAPDGLATAPIFGLGAQPLQGGEIVANGTVTLESYIGPLLNSGAVCWVLLECDGGAQQVAPATQSHQAVSRSQVFGLDQTQQNVTSSRALGTTYTNSSGKAIFLSAFVTIQAGQACDLIIDGAIVAAQGNVATQLTGFTMVGMIPVGSTYSLSSAGVVLNTWYEFR